MVQVYSCKCLNIQVFGQDPQQKYDSECLKTCPLVNPKVIELIDPGFNFVHKCLVLREKREPWTVYICVFCHMITHAINAKANLLVINADLKVGENAMKAMRNLPEYSKVFKVVLSNPAVQQIDNVVRRQSYEILQKQIGDLQAVLNSYLRQEEDRMEKRIQKYEQEQRAIFEKVAHAAKQEKTQLVSVLFNNSERGDFTALPEKAATRANPPLTHSKSMVESRNSAPSNQQAFGQRKNAPRMRDSSPDLFAMEELEIDDSNVENPIPDPSNRSDLSSRLNSNEEDDEQQFLRNRSTRIGFDPDEPITEVDDFSLMSTSVPISMPGEHFRSRRNTTQGPFRGVDDDFEDEAAEFDDIPRHMQALSESIQERDRYIFGERPRQRVNTADFSQVKSYWK